MSRHPTRIVSSQHLVSEASAELSEFEYGLIMASNAFNCWIVRCMAAAGGKDMTATEVCLLHNVSHRERKKKLADICFVLSIEDTHVVKYALKKLVVAIGRTPRPAQPLRSKRHSSVRPRERAGQRCADGRS